MPHSPHRDKILGMSEPISRRDFLDGVLVTSTGMLAAAACPFPLAAQVAGADIDGWAGYGSEGDDRTSAGDPEEGKPAPREALCNGPFGRIAFSHADLVGAMDHRDAFIESERAVSQLMDGVLI